MPPGSEGYQERQTKLLANMPSYQRTKEKIQGKFRQDQSEEQQESASSEEEEESMEDEIDENEVEDLDKSEDEEEEADHQDVDVVVDELVDPKFEKKKVREIYNKYSHSTTSSFNQNKVSNQLNSLNKIITRHFNAKDQQADPPASSEAAPENLTPTNFTNLDSSNFQNTPGDIEDQTPAKPDFKPLQNQDSGLKDLD
mmetsp:Transcript_4062/g.6872  ORF Transcript_4062/g.6872 Transcript_4062/m.6872 type:complete len:198 (-) Transcript_4062:87-680(-)